MLRWAVVLSSWYFGTSAGLRRSSQYDYDACPVNHSPEYFCCVHENGDQDLFTFYQMPTLSPSYSEYYYHGWTQLSRQINYPDSKYTPSSPSFYYQDDKEICRLHPDTKDIICKLRENDSASKFMTYRTNSRNNNASCPSSSTLTKLTFANGTHNEQAIDACRSLQQKKTGYENVYFQTYFEWPLVVIYLMYSSYFVVLVLWYLFTRHVQSRQGSLLQKQSFWDKEKSAQLPMLQCGYTSSTFGTLLKVVGITLSLLMNIWIIILICDATYNILPIALFNRQNPKAITYISLFSFEALLYCGIIRFASALPNFFRIPVELANAEFVLVTCFEERDEIHVYDSSGISQIMYKLHKFSLRDWNPFSKEAPSSSTKSCSSIKQTVPVEMTIDMKYINFNHQRYIYDEEQDAFSCRNGLSHDQARVILNTIGSNSIDIPMPSMIESIQCELFRYFYVYQLLIYFTEIFYNKWYAGMILIFIMFFTVAINIKTRRQMQQAVCDMAKHEGSVRVCRSEQWQTISIHDIVPQDVIDLDSCLHATVPADMVVVEGSVIVDEAMLTGESFPVRKHALAGQDQKAESPNTLYCGTTLLALSSSEAEGKTIAIVTATNVATKKGQLLQQMILSPPVVYLKSSQHFRFLLMILFVIAVIICYIAILFFVQNGNLSNKLNAFAYILFAVAGIINPLLPVVLTFGYVKAAQRLAKQQIVSLNVERVGLAGKVRLFAFDKTGTLTKQGLDFVGVLPAFETQIQSQVSQQPEHWNFNSAMACCHTLSLLDGRLVGSEVEVEMVKASGWHYSQQHSRHFMIPGGEHKGGYEILKRFEFNRESMTMTVVARDVNTNRCFVFTKGSYERVGALASPETIPNNYYAAANESSKNGCYVLGAAFAEARDAPTKEQDLLKWTTSLERNELEKDLTCLGLLLFRNELKPETFDTIRKLQRGNTRSIMITGDNALCGSYIAREAGMIARDANVIVGAMEDGKCVWRDIDAGDEELSLESVKRYVKLQRDHFYPKLELAVTGECFDFLSENNLLGKLLLGIRIFSRMTPEGKIRCIQEHMRKGIITAMCGDGGNDCGALRIAHVGIALSDAEASMVSPFTSKTKDIRSVIDLCRAGRCSIATSFASVKFLVVFGFVASSLRLVQYRNGIIMSEWCWIMSESFITIGLSYFVIQSAPHKSLGPERPTSSFLGPTTVFSVLGQTAINLSFLYWALSHLTSRPWYCPFDPKGSDVSKWWLLSDNALATCVFFMIILQQQAPAFVYSFGGQFRESIWRNYGLCIYYSILLGVEIYFVIGPPNQLTDLFRIASSTNVVGLPDIPLPWDFRVEFLCIMLFNFLCVILFEYFVILGPVRRFFRSRYHKDRLHLHL